MVKKYHKQTDLEFYNIKGELEGHIFAMGRVGAGKSVSLLSVVQGFHDNFNYKIWDIFGGERNEGVFWTIPSQEKDYWARMGLLGTVNEAGPKQYAVTLLYPYFESKLPRKLPKKGSYIKSKLFTIPMQEVDVEDIKMVCGNMSDSSSYVWNEILYNSKKTDNAGALLNLSNKIKGIANSNTILYKNFIIPMHREKFLADKYADTNLDLIAEAKDKNTITVLCLEFVPEKFHLFIMSWIMRKMSELIDVNRIPKKNILFIREAATFFRATEDSVLEDRFKIFRTTMSHFIRMGRRGQYFCLDCQSSSEVKGLVQGSEDYLMMFRTTAWRDKEDMCGELKREKRMRTDQMAGLAFLDKGQCYVAETGRNVKKIQITLPRTMFWKKDYPNFYKVLWEKFGGEWHTTAEVSDYIDERYAASLHDSNERFAAKKKKSPQDIVEMQPQIQNPIHQQIANQPQAISMYDLT